MKHRNPKLLLVVLSAVIAGLAVALYAVASGDHEATANDGIPAVTYIRARYAQQFQFEAELSTAQRTVAAYVDRIAGECAGALKNAPDEGIADEKPEGNRLGSIGIGARDLILLEAVDALEIVLSHTRFRATHRFARAIEGLEWSNSQAGGLIRSLVQVEVARLEESVPDICRDIVSWAKSDYHTLPPRAEDSEPKVEAIRLKLAHELSAAGCSTAAPGAEILRMLQVEQLAKGTHINRLAKVESTVDRRDDQMVAKATARIERALGISSGAHLVHASGGGGGYPTAIPSCHHSS